MKLANQRIVVVGGSSGMGLATAQAIAHQGATVVITSRHQENLDDARHQIVGQVETWLLDFTDEFRVKDFFIQVGQIDHLILAAAGPPAWGNLVDLETAALQQAFTTKFWGYFYCAKYALPHLRADGSILFFTGAAGRAALPGTVGLAAVNGAILSMAHTLAKELAPLRVNAISPGLVDTPAYDWMREEEKQAFFEQMSRNLPVGRVGQAVEIAEAVVFLIANGFVTGTVLDVDGGARL